MHTVWASVENVPSAHDSHTLATAFFPATHSLQAPSSRMEPGLQPEHSVFSEFATCPGPQSEQTVAPAAEIVLPGQKSQLPWPSWFENLPASHAAQLSPFSRYPFLHLQSAFLLDPGGAALLLSKQELHRSPIEYCPVSEQSVHSVMPRFSAANPAGHDVHA